MPIKRSASPAFSTPKRTRSTPPSTSDLTTLSLPTPPPTRSKKTTDLKPTLSKPSPLPSSSKLRKLSALGTSPYTSFLRPTPEECQNVFDLLTSGKNHGPIVPPPELGELAIFLPDTPNLTLISSHQVDSPLATCGEVPLVLDALFRTILSQSTTARNATQGKLAMDARYGRADFRAILDDKGGEAELAKTVDCAGLGKKKAEYMMGILRALDKDEDREGRLDLEWLRDLETNEAMKVLVSFNGVGIKTASCICLFTLGRPSFAVDTHVHRISTSLGWLPPSCTTPDDAFLHLDARIPDHLKYPLHSLFVHHGRSCRKCSSNGVISNEECVECGIDGVVVRKARKVRKAKGKGGKGKKEEDEDEDEKGLEAVQAGGETGGSSVKSEKEEEKVFWEGKTREGSPLAQIKSEEVGANVTRASRTRQVKSEVLE